MDDTHPQSISFSNVACDRPFISRPFLPQKWSRRLMSFPSQLGFSQTTLTVPESDSTIPVDWPQIGQMRGNGGIILELSSALYARSAV